MSGARDLSEVRALLQLDAMPAVGLRTIVRLVEEFGSARRALAAPRGLFNRVGGGRVSTGRADPELLELIDHGLAEAARIGMSVRSWRHSVYPEAFHHLADPPPVLFLRGDESLLSRPGVTIVGARKATERGRDIAYRLGAGLARAGVTVVSGMALGVDGAAHRGTLSVGGATVAVLGRGADQPYPRSHGSLFREILGSGLVVSEFLPGTPALPHHFPRRNRLLAGLAHTVVVVEAAKRSGSLITVEHALDLGLDVFAVPGPIDHPSCEGSNALLGDGALPVVSIQDFVARFSERSDSDAGEDFTLDGMQGDVFSGLAMHPIHVDDVASQAGLTVPETLAVLTSLELLGYVEQRPGLRFKRAA
jgi:DNA processing protein